MRRCLLLCLVGLSLLGAQSLDFRGSGTVYATGIKAYQLGGQFLPILEGNFLSQESPYILDAEVSANSYAYYDSSRTVSADFSPYRCWARFAGSQFEFRAGLQKITFGQAQMLRPLMWYDSIDPRDPLNLTKGKWAVRARYYFPGSNNNVWFWGMSESSDDSYMFIEGVNCDDHVYSGGLRIQADIWGGETGISGGLGHYDSFVCFDEAVEQHTTEADDYRLGLDIKWDMEVGFWMEAAAVFRNSSYDFNSVSFYKHSRMATYMVTLGADYTLPVGNGIYVMAEAMLTDVNMILNDPIITGLSEELTVWDEQVFMTAFMVQYPLGIFDAVGFMSFVLPQSGFKHYSYLFWQRQYDNITLRLSGALTNLDAGEFTLPGTASSTELGNMIQFMLVYDFKLKLIQ